MVYLGRSYHFRFLKGCIPQILFGPFLNTLSQMLVNVENVLFALGYASARSRVHMRFGTISTICKTWKTPKEECCF